LLSCCIVNIVNTVDTAKVAKQHQQLQEQPLLKQALEQAQPSDLDALLESSRALIAGLDSTFGTQQAPAYSTDSTTAISAATSTSTAAAAAAATTAGVPDNTVPKRSCSSINSSNSVSLREQAAHNAATVLTPTNSNSADNRCVTISLHNIKTLTCTETARTGVWHVLAAVSRC
jgi:hypothetical protein